MVLKDAADLQGGRVLPFDLYLIRGDKGFQLWGGGTFDPESQEGTKDTGGGSHRCLFAVGVVDLAPKGDGVSQSGARGRAQHSGFGAGWQVSSGFRGRGPVGGLLNKTTGISTMS